MLTCLPESLCSWDYRVIGAAEGPCEVRFDFLTEQGSILLGGVFHEVVKHGWLSGQWSLTAAGATVAGATKPSAFVRSFEVTVPEGAYVLRARTFLTRVYEIASTARTIGTITPAHALTRRATIDCEGELSELSQLFCFWLAVITWRRAARDNSANSSS